MSRALPSLLLALVASGCSGAMRDPGLFENAADTAGDDIPEGTLRLDLGPPANIGGDGLLAQSAIVAPGNYEGLTVELLRTRTVSGTLSADVARGWAFGPPTSTEALVATLQPLPGDGKLTGAAQSNEDGTFTLTYPDYPPGRFPIAIVPADASMAPLRILAAPTDDADAWDQHLEPGIPVYGRVTARVGDEVQGIPGVAMRISREAGDEVLRSGTFTTDATGWYTARVDEIGEYTLEVVGGPTADADDGFVAPSLAEAVLVESEDGVAVDVSLGSVRDATATAFIVDAAGNPVQKPRMRYTSVTLESGVGSLVVEQEGQSSGDVTSSRLLPGTYDIEIMPSPEEAANHTPTRIPNVRITNGAELGTYTLGAAGRLSGFVDDLGGDAAGQVLVVATEVGFGGNVYYTYTDGNGQFDLAVPDVPLTVAFTPANPAQGAVTFYEVEDPSTNMRFALAEGVLVDGVVTWQAEPVAYSSVEVHDAASGVLLGQALTNEEGYFSLRVSVPRSEDVDGDDTGADTGREADTGDTGRDSGDTADTADTADTGRDTADPADTARDSGDTAAR